MAGYFLYSLAPGTFERQTTIPTTKECAIIAKAVIEEVQSSLDDYDGSRAADRSKWPTTVGLLATAIRERLAASDWYADFTMGDAYIWERIILRSWEDEPGKELGLDFECENPGDLRWEVAGIAVERGAMMMAEPAFGNAGFRYSGTSRTKLQLGYTIYLPGEVERLWHQLEKVTPYFELQPARDETRTQFFEGLFEPVRQVFSSGRVMWVQTDT